MLGVQNHCKPVSETLVSAKNPLLKEIRRAAARGALTEDGLALAEGPHLLDEAERSGLEIGAVIRSESYQGPDAAAARVVTVPDPVFAQITSTETPQGVLALVRLPAWSLDDVFRGTPLVIALDGIQDPGNAGAIVRAAEAFGATGAVFLKGSVSPYNPKCLRASAGSTFRLPFVAGLDESAVLDRSGVAIYAAAPRAALPLWEAKLAQPCILVIGGEGVGVRPELAARATAVSIPTTTVESLNAAVAAGILLYEARRQRNPA
jgi:RNA methyltransferase, TrmH family